MVARDQLQANRPVSCGGFHEHSMSIVFNEHCCPRSVTCTQAGLTWRLFMSMDVLAGAADCGATGQAVRLRRGGGQDARRRHALADAYPKGGCAAQPPQKGPGETLV